MLFCRKRGIGTIMILAMTMAAALAAHATQATPPRRARANLNQYFSTDDYPPTALARGAQGTVGFRLEIGADGVVTRCTITRSSTNAALDSATCAILLGRVRYEPARNAAGRAVPGEDAGRVTWRLPPPGPGPFARLRTVSRLSSDGAGLVSCAVTVNGVVDPDVAPDRCGAMTGDGTDDLLRELPAPSEVTMITVAGPADAGDEPVGEDEAGYGDLQYDLASDVVIAQDGRIAECRRVRRTLAAIGLADTPDLCTPRPPEAPPMFAPSTDPAPRRVRYRYALYVKGWLAGQLAVPAPAPASPPVPPGGDR
jgi:TonB family protein